MEQATPEARQSAQDRLLAAAAMLFYRDGIAAIVRKAGVARKSLYNNFASKSDLVAAYLRLRHAEWLALHRDRAAGATGPAAQVLAVFDACPDHARRKDERGFRGCRLLNAAGEFPEGDAGRAAVRAHKEEVEAIIARHTAGLMPGDPARAAHPALLLEGATVRAGLEGRGDCLAQARDFAAAMLAAP